MTSDKGKESGSLAPLAWGFEPQREGEGGGEGTPLHSQTPAPSPDQAEGPKATLARYDSHLHVEKER